MVDRDLIRQKLADIGSPMKRSYHMDQADRDGTTQCLSEELASDPRVVFAYLHGSFVESQAFHDIDVGVYLQNVRDDQCSAVGLDLAQRLSDKVRMPVDVRPLNMAPVSFVYHVLRGSLLYCRNEAVLAELMERTISRYLDMAPLLRWATKDAFGS